MGTHVVNVAGPKHPKSKHVYSRYENVPKPPEGHAYSFPARNKQTQNPRKLSICTAGMREWNLNILSDE